MSGSCPRRPTTRTMTPRHASVLDRGSPHLRPLRVAGTLHIHGRVTGLPILTQLRIGTPKHPSQRLAAADRGRRPQRWPARLDRQNAQRPGRPDKRDRPERGSEAAGPAHSRVFRRPGSEPGASAPAATGGSSTSRTERSRTRIRKTVAEGQVPVSLVMPATAWIGMTVGDERSRVKIGMAPPRPGSIMRTEMRREPGLSVSRAAGIPGVGGQRCRISRTAWRACRRRWHSGSGRPSERPWTCCCAWEHGTTPVRCAGVPTGSTSSATDLCSKPDARVMENANCSGSPPRSWTSAGSWTTRGTFSIPSLRPSY